MSSKWLVILGFALSSCAVKQSAPLSWRMNGRILLPPGVAAEAPSNSFKATVAKKGCPPNDAITVQGKKVTVQREAFMKQGRGAVTTWSEPRRLS